MSGCLGVCLFVSLFVCLCVCLSVCVISFYLFVFLSSYPSICLSSCLSVFLSAFMPVCLSMCLFVSLFMRLSVYQSVCLPIFCLSLFSACLCVRWPYNLCLKDRIPKVTCGVNRVHQNRKGGSLCETVNWLEATLCPFKESEGGQISLLIESSPSLSLLLLKPIGPWCPLLKYGDPWFPLLI